MHVSALQIIIILATLAGSIWAVLEAYWRHCAEANEAWSWKKAAWALWTSAAAILAALQATQLPATEMQLPLNELLIAAYTACMAAKSTVMLGNSVKNIWKTIAGRS